LSAGRAGRDCFHARESKRTPLPTPWRAPASAEPP
jgi:hypothetical protein